MAIRRFGQQALRRVPGSLRQREFALFWSGQTTSLVGDGIYTVALALETLRLSNHASALSYVLAARAAPAVIAMLFAGTVVDRLPRRLLVLGADCGRGLSVAAIAILAGLHTLDVTELMVISAAIGLGDAFFYPAFTAIVPELLPSELLAQGNAFNSGSQVLGVLLVGPAIAGVLIATAGAPAAFGVDAASFMISAVCLLWMRPLPAPTPSGARMLADTVAGLRWVRRQAWLWWGILAVAVVNFAAFSPVTVLAPLLVRDVLHQGTVAYGLVFAAAGGGGGVAAFVVGRLGTPRRIVTVTWASWGVGCLAVLALGFASGVYAAGAFMAIAYAMLTVGNLLWHTMMQRLVPLDRLGRASSVDWLFSLCLTPLGVLVGGVLATSFGVRNTLVLGGGIAAAACLVVTSPRVREPDRSGLFDRRPGPPPAADMTRASLPATVTGTTPKRPPRSSGSK